ncbi:SPOR domain-containing protein [Sphingomonas jatrophae]|uniref:Sporulation related domain-containing protein n=1 Tax=Sphingomonas jatrophae TaxID=1166337 RepID=A0A1I6JG64_9SPHN|nr:SPOR domain-containing protein [Sphingomonas jatrophae]SFR77938.1 Sporulation related domain-containing protein [Sphingomonas jatrophae]
MSDIGRGVQPGNEDRLPWLEAVDDEAEPRGPGAGRLVAAVIVALAIIGLVVGGIFWLRDRPADGADGELIAAPDGAYKTKPGDAGGMKVEGQGDTSYAASEGADTDGAIDLTKLPETPVTEDRAVTQADAAAAKPPTPAATPPAPAATAKIAAAPAPVPAAPKAAAPAPVAAPAKPQAPVTGGTIQLGAFGSEAKANAAWKTMSKRFGFLAGLTPTVTPVAVGEKTFYRLRVAAGAQAGTICGKLTVAGETCARIG